MMKKILFDLLSAQPVKSTKYHGGGEYIKSVFKYMAENYSNKVSITVFYDYNAFVDENLLETIKENNIKTVNILNIGQLNEHLKMSSYDILYAGMPYDYGKLDIPSNITCIGTFHGFRALEKYTDKNEKKYYNGYKVIKPIMKQLLYPLRINNIYNYYLKSISKFDKIIFSSKHTMYAFENFFPDMKKVFKMLYVPAKHIEMKNEVEEEKVVNLGKYVLLIGVNRWEKNSYRAIEAIENLFKNNLLQEYKIVTIGKMPKKIYKIIKNKDRYVNYDYVETEILELLYKNCDIFFYPSLNEGFGLPPLEAMKYGKTCVVSGICSLPELYGDVVYYINPYDINEMCTRILNATKEKKDYNLVINQQKKIFEQQEKDLERLCEYIIN